MSLVGKLHVELKLFPPCNMLHSLIPKGFFCILCMSILARTLYELYDDVVVAQKDNMDVSSDA